MIDFGASFWLSVAFLIFVGLVAKPVGRVVGNALDARADRIRQELDEALKLKEEAQALLAATYHIFSTQVRIPLHANVQS